MCGGIFLTVTAPLVLALGGSATAAPLRLEAPSAPAVKGGREVAALATARSRTWVKPDGAYVTRIYQRAVNARAADGSWAHVDNRLRASAGGYVNGVGEYKLRLPETLADPVVMRRGSHSLSMRLLGASNSRASVDGVRAQYVAVAPGVSASWVANDAGPKEDLVLESAAAQSSFSYELQLDPNLTPKMSDEGGVLITDADGEVVFNLAAPFAIDADGAVAPPQAASMVLSKVASGWRLRVEIDATWLQSPARAFPVTLDPSAVLGAARDCFVDAGAASTSYCASGLLWVGTSSSRERRGLMAFDLAGTVPAGSFVQSATLNMYALYQTSPGVSKQIAVHRATSDWDNAATWTSRKAGTSWTAPGGDYASADLDSQPIPAAGTWAQYSVTDAVDPWLNGSIQNQGFVITDDTSTVNNSVVFASSDHATSSNAPWLEIEYFPSAGNMPGYTLDTQRLTTRSELSVNVAGGNLLLTSHDLSVAGPGFPLAFDRYYNSQDPWSGVLGSKGRLSLGNDIALYQCDNIGSRCLVGPSGYRVRFMKNADGSYTTPYGVGNMTLRRLASGRFELTNNKSGLVYGFFDNAFSYVDDVHDQHGNQLTFSYSGAGNALSAITDTAGRTYTVTSNAQGLITSISVPTSVLPGGATWSYTYAPGDDLLASVTDPEGNTTTYTYTTDGYDLLTKIVDGKGLETSITYDTSQRVTSVTRKVDGTPANDVTTTYSYASASAPCDAATAVTKTIKTDPRGKATTFCSNQQGNVVQAFDPLGRNMGNAYDQQGNATKLGAFAASNPVLGQTTLAYTGPLGTQNVSDITAPAGEHTEFTYPSSTDPLVASRPTKITDPQGNSQYLTYDASGNLVQVADAASSPTMKQTLTYRPDGQILTATDGRGNTTTYGYDAQGNRTSVTPPNASIGATTYTYDGLSRVKTVTDGRGKVTTYTYDRLGQVTGVSDSAGVSTTITYDQNGNVVTRTTGGSSTTGTFDTLNRKTSEVLPGGAANNYGYDKSGNLISIVDAGGTTLYGYDDAGRLISVNSPTATTGADTTTFAYSDPTTAVPVSVATATLPAGGIIARTSDVSGKLVQVLAKTAGGAQVLKRTWSYSPGSVQHQRADSMAAFTTGATPATTTNYTYDVNGQLLEAKTVNGTAGSNVRDDVFTYDAAGNRTKRVRTDNSSAATTTTSAYNANNQLCWRYSGIVTAPTCGGAPSGATQYTYDLAGNQLSNPTATWDARGRLASLAGSLATVLSADDNNELTALGTSSFVNNVLGVSRATVGGAVSSYVRNPEDGSVISQVAAGAKRWFIADNVGSTIGLADSGGTVARTYTYDTDGIETTAGGGPDTWIKFQGGHLLGSSANGIIHFGARYYEPSTGRWTQPDPLLQPSDLVQANRYAFVGNDPINGSDPTGLYRCLHYAWNGYKIVYVRSCIWVQSDGGTRTNGRYADTGVRG
jgi:RHS repeat-associated protein